MKKSISVFSMIVLVAVLFGRGLDGRIEAIRSDNSVSENRTVFTYEENFETGSNDWTHIDGTLPSNMWHLAELYDPQQLYGYIWWMGDEELVGYYDHQYTYLDTDEIAVPAGGHLTFNLVYATEEPGTNSAAPEYNGWDGCNVRISTDGGSTWQVISGYPAYDVTSLYSFGSEFGEGPDIPGWAGSSDDWVDADFDLSGYAGQNVRIRFAFASDPETNTTNNENWFGMAIDNIELGDFSNDGVAAGMTPGTMLPTAGDFWALTQPAGGAASPLYAYTCQDGDSYPQGAYNLLQSGWYPIDNFGYYGGHITADFKIRGSFVNEPGTYWIWQVQSDFDHIWRNMTNPTGSSSGQNFVFGSPDTDEWVHVTDIYPGLSGRMDSIIADSLTFRIIFVSSADTQPQGTGIMIDDFTLSLEEFTGPPPVNLQATTLNNGYVSLSWNSGTPVRVQSYNLYQGMHLDGPWELLETSQDSFYIHIDPVADELNYYTVTTLFSDDDESDFAQSVGTFVPVQGAIQLSQDDGSAEERFSAEPMDLIATKLYSPDPLTPVYTGVFIDSLRNGPLVIKLWDDDGPGGRPGSELLTQPFSVSATELELGWNFFSLPHNCMNGVIDGYFYMGLLETADVSYIGVDTANSGFSYRFQGESWLPVTQGTLMLRAVVAPTVAVDSAVPSSPTISAWNAPNPFTPGASQRSIATTIHLSIPGYETAQVHIFNVRGQRLLKEKVRLQNGEGILNWNGLDANGNPTASGLYLYTVQAGNSTVSRKMMILK